jgi:lysozyme
MKTEFKNHDKPNVKVTNIKPNIYGIDISHHQNNEIDVVIKNSDSLDFIICKATEGMTYIDPKFTRNWRMIKDHGFIRGAYHFYITKDDPITQAKFFLKTIDNIDSMDIPPIVDFEEGGINESQSVEKVQSALLLFLNHIETQSNRKPIIYTDLNVGNRYLNHSNFSDYNLWIANYSQAKKPNLPKAWAQKGWTIWQKSETYKINNKKNDFDIFNGNQIEFKEFIKNSNIKN